MPSSDDNLSPRPSILRRSRRRRNPNRAQSAARLAARRQQEWDTATLVMDDSQLHVWQRLEDQAAQRQDVLDTQREELRQHLRTLHVTAGEPPHGEPFEPFSVDIRNLDLDTSDHDSLPCTGMLVRAVDFRGIHANTTPPGWYAHAFVLGRTHTRPQNIAVRFQDGHIDIVSPRCTRRLSRHYYNNEPLTGHGETDEADSDNEQALMHRDYNLRAWRGSEGWCRCTLVTRLTQNIYLIRFQRDGVVWTLTSNMLDGRWENYLFTVDAFATPTTNVDQRPVEALTPVYDAIPVQSADEENSVEGTAWVPQEDVRVFI